jgi:hypothetical protein
VVPPASRRPAAWAWWLLRIFSTVQAADIFLQPVFEGRFLSGDFAALAAHRSNAVYVGALTITQVLVGILAWRVSRMPGWIVGLLALLGVSVGIQIYLGFSRVLGIHIPLGVAIIGVSGWVTVWLWSHRPPGPGTRREQS